MTVRKQLGRWSQRLQDPIVTNWVAMLDAFAHLVPAVRPNPGLVARGYEVMQDRLRTSLAEIEQQKRQLRESEEEVRRSRDFLQAIIDSLDDDLMVLDQWRHITRANRSLAIKHDRSVIGRCCYEVTHGASSPCGGLECECPLQQVWKTGIPARVIHVHRQGEDGTVQYVEVSTSPLFDSRGRVARVVEMQRDVTASMERERQVVDANRRLVALNTIAGSVSQSLSLDFVLNCALENALEQLDAETGAILLVDERDGKLARRIHRGTSHEGYPRFGERVAADVAATGEAVVVDDVTQDPRTRDYAAAVGVELGAFISMPLKTRERTVGILTCASLRPHSFSDQALQLLDALGHQLGVAIENARLYQELQEKDRIRAEILRQVITAQEDERRRVARELHDVTSQALTTLAVRLEAAMATPLAAGDRLESRLRDLRPLLDQTSKEVHRLIYDLRPSLLDDLGLAAAVRSCAHNALDGAGIEVHVEVVGRERRLASATEIAIFRIMQEAITNVARHARAESVYISLEFREAAVCLQIEDDGEGFDVAKVLEEADVSSCFGLLGMKERAELLGGGLEVATGVGEGTRVTVEIPIGQPPHG